jgi:glycosyltransferase involved in cell wall biosynthesis
VAVGSPCIHLDRHDRGAKALSVMRPAVVVLTPVKNEAWILDRFLSVSSAFADRIIVLDQGSTDGSTDICARYEKVHLIHNPDRTYDEAARQRRLIETARELIRGPRILLALDSDEILAGDALTTDDWSRMMTARPGTVLYFEKPELFQSPHNAIRYKEPWPLGYVDDGCEHRATKIHSIRIPQPQYATQLRLLEIKILHYALTRPEAQRAKMRYYSVVENMNMVAPFYARRRRYSKSRDFVRAGTLEASPAAWFEAWQSMGIDMFTIERPEFYWQDFEVLRFIGRQGSTRFWLDDIWDLDWETVRQRGVALGYPDMPSFKVTSPPVSLQQVLRGLDRAKDIYDERVKGRMTQVFSRM